jgi:hypothetical protein
VETATLNLTRTTSTGIAQLSKEVSVGVFYDSAARTPPERHSETQNAALEEVYEWIGHLMKTRVYFGSTGQPAQASPLLHKPLQNVVPQASSLLPLSSFLTKILWATIAFQIAMCLPALRRKIGQAIEDDPTIYQKSPMRQLQTLIIDSFSPLEGKVENAPSTTSNPFFVVIDGLDECQMHAEQRDVLCSVANIIATHHLPSDF